MTEEQAKDQDKFVLRMPAGMRDRIKAAAERRNRSMNAEIIATLEEAYPRYDFNVGAFLEEWMVPILKQADWGKRIELLGAANDFLSKHSDGMEVSIEGTGGRLRTVLKMGTQRMTVEETPDAAVESPSPNSDPDTQVP